MTNFRKPKECVNMPCMYKVHVKEQSGDIEGDGGGGGRKLVLAIVDFKINDRSRHTHKSIFRFAHVDKPGKVQISVDQCTPYM